MVVVTIIGILAAIAIPNYIVMRERTHQAAVKENMHSTQVCVNAFSIDTHGLYPSDVNTSGQGFGYYFPGGDEDGQSVLGTMPTNPYTGREMVVAEFVVFNYAAQNDNSNPGIPGPNYLNLGGAGFIGYGRWSILGAYPWSEYGIIGSGKDHWSIKISGNQVIVLHN